MSLVNDKHDVLSDIGVFWHVLTDKLIVPELFRWKVAYLYIKVINPQCLIYVRTG